MNVAMILAGGCGTRAGFDTPKQFVNVYDKPIIAYTIELFEMRKDIEIIEVGCHPDYLGILNDLISKYNYKKVKYIVNGGETFQDTVINCTKFLNNKIDDNDIVLIHYSAAPFTSQKIIDDAIHVCSKYDISISCTPCYQLLGSNDEGRTSKSWIDRDKCIQIACPQCFKYKILKDIYIKATQNGLLNKVEPHTTSLAYALGYTLYQSYGDQTNIKITTKEDIELFKGWVRRNEK